MPFCDVTDLFEYWRESPPMHILMAGYVGYKPPMKRSEEAEQAFPMLRNATHGTTKKLSKAPKYIQDVVQKMKDKPNG
jgi:hypothetical protein